MPRSTRFAAAASPTGPAPITATGRLLGFVTCILLFPKLSKYAVKKRSGDLLPARCVHAAFIHQITDEIVHGRIIGAADERGPLPLLGDQAGVSQMPDMVRQCRRRHPELRLNRADRQSAFAGAHESAVELQTDRAAKRFQLAGGYFEFHGINMAEDRKGVKLYFDFHRNIVLAASAGRETRSGTASRARI